MALEDAVDASDHPAREFSLQSEHELRFEIPPDVASASLTLLTGSAELFGLALAQNKPYHLAPSLNAAAFTWHGATLALRAPKYVMAYTATDTPMPSYINAHSILQSKRQVARRAGIPGPRAVVVGPHDCGKTALVNILAAYCVRANRTAVVADMDPSAGGAVGTMPATIALSLVSHLDLEAGNLVHERLATLMVGHHSPRHNVPVSERAFNKLAALLDKVMGMSNLDPWVGALADTSGDILAKDGTDGVIQAIRAMNADVVFVLGAERLYAAIKSTFESTPVEAVLLAKSGGVISRDAATRQVLRSNAIKSYFYGADNRLSPFSIAIEFDKVIVLRVGGEATVVPDSVLPAGASSSLDPLKPVRITSVADVLHNVLAVSQATDEKDVFDMPLFGFLHVVKVDVERNSMTVLAPSPGTIPSTILLVGDTKWVE
ncbi:Protein CLP1-like [Gracilariopsis chorda]|uniref:Protein CLP1-like n=1 Tax=Gracilariopsis chorda TaxID=448386 RepID=A0A2V3IFC3_9FLOR|nr:Protein CLP1-like [Gracilariopsis chorda]|eukprot:PXF40752.1 Protein CLP1-like [Gracilariopsis chorda]